MMNTMQYFLLPIYHVGLILNVIIAITMRFDADEIRRDEIRKRQKQHLQVNDTTGRIRRRPVGRNDHGGGNFGIFNYR